ncbi:MAG TPA: YdeI/OmpD-associated family protein [Anaerolineales bacterium]|nr:YdeI/OmpD-associated family protein [Anaerolineales bacterium]
MSPKPPMKAVDYPVLPFTDKQAWAKWLDEEHDRAAGIWLKFAKKNSGIPSLTYEDAVEVALCYGWIDGQMKGFDAKYWLQKFTPRRAKSIWSKINTERAERLIARGEMRPAGLREVEAAKQDGRWQAAYASQKNMTVPQDFQSALNKNKKARAFYETLSGANRYAILFRIETAKKAETRARRIEKFVEMLERGEKLYI